ncbi:hypothetical protein MMC28_000627 [Mycoblastus sanguinarius]|nr:hypothetical protein [Mycoblastus sanguinarius]
MTQSTLFSQQPIQLEDIAPNVATEGGSSTPETPTEERRSSHPFPFLALPQELRLTIYELTLISPFILSWRGAYSLKNHCLRTAKQRNAKRATDALVSPFKIYVCNTNHPYRPPSYDIASPLLACRTIYIESAPLFYRNNNFCFSTVTNSLPIAFESQTFLSCLRFVTIGSPIPEHRGCQLDRADTTISVSIDWVVGQCPALERFTVHVPKAGDGRRPRVRSSELRQWFRMVGMVLIATVSVLGVFAIGHAFG